MVLEGELTAMAFIVEERDEREPTFEDNFGASRTLSVIVTTIGGEVGKEGEARVVTMVGCWCCEGFWFEMFMVKGCFT